MMTGDTTTTMMMAMVATHQSLQPHETTLVRINGYHSACPYAAASLGPPRALTVSDARAPLTRVSLILTLAFERWVAMDRAASRRRQFRYTVTP